MLGVGAAGPMQGEHDLSPYLVEVGDHLVDKGTHDPLLEPRVRRGR
jgi:hypothetical protein